jgi:hypothetical protein
MPDARCGIGPTGEPNGEVKVKRELLAPETA